VRLSDSGVAAVVEAGEAGRVAAVSAEGAEGQVPVLVAPVEVARRVRFRADLHCLGEAEFVLRAGGDPAPALAGSFAGCGGTAAAAADAVQLYRERHELVGALPIADFFAPGQLDSALRRSALAMRVPARWVRVVARRRSFARRYAYWAAVRRAATEPEWVHLTATTTILMYHAFDEKERSRFVVRRRDFRRQLWILRRLRCRFVTLDDYVGSRGAPPPRGLKVVLTADDGYMDNLAIAAVEVERKGAPLLVFVVTQPDRAVDWQRDGLEDRPVLRATEVARAMPPSILFGAHTQTHPVLTRLTPEQVREEVAGSKRDLEQALDADVRFFAYPHGSRSPAVETAVAEAGFAAACGIERGKNTFASPLLALRRVPVDGDRGISSFLCAVLLGDPDVLVNLFAAMTRRVRPR
jgi:peptidoglycan/xylan/chitin deacetylase (PgdA/CDA1 family)